MLFPISTWVEPLKNQLEGTLIAARTKILERMRRQGIANGAGHKACESADAIAITAELIDNLVPGLVHDSATSDSGGGGAIQYLLPLLQEMGMMSDDARKNHCDLHSMNKASEIVLQSTIQQRQKLDQFSATLPTCNFDVAYKAEKAGQVDLTCAMGGLILISKLTVKSGNLPDIIAELKARGVSKKKYKDKNISALKELLRKSEAQRIIDEEPTKERINLGIKSLQSSQSQMR